jgi:hypothetical protein
MKREAKSEEGTETEREGGDREIVGERERECFLIIFISFLLEK